MNHTRYYLGFNLTPGIGPARLSRLIEHFGSIRNAWEASAADLLASGLDSKSVESLLATRGQVDLDDELEQAQRVGAQLLTIEDPDYPSLLRQIPQPPPLIYVRGTLTPADEWAFAIVGTRGPTTYGKEATQQLAGDLAAAGVTIVSGMAAGIDSVAHIAALEAGGRTIAVLGSGVDVPYPERNRHLAGEIVERGAIISEFPLGTQPAAPNFPSRNRIISGLALGTLVVEAGLRSGALITVSFALEQGREVFVIPGSIFSRASQGTNRLIRNGAALVTCAQDILEALNWTTAVVQQEMTLTMPEDPTEAALLTLMTYEPQYVDEISRTSGLPTASVSAALAMLELKGAVRQAGPMQYVLARGQMKQSL